MSKAENKHAKSNKDKKKKNTNNKIAKTNQENKTKNTNTRTKNKKEKTKQKGFWERHRKFAIFLKISIVLCILLCIAVAGTIVAIFNNDKWDLSNQDLILKFEDTIILDNEGNEKAHLSGEEKRRIVPYEEIPKQLKDAYISIEDERFYEHKGIDLKRTLGATVTYVLNRGNSSYGGSTITQQLIKNLKEDKSDSGIEGIQRKIREMSRAYKLEQKLSKDQILTLYLNLIFVGGQNICGVELGSRYYFNKSVQELDLAQCAFLAGINHAPNAYNPYTGKDNGEKIKKRTKTVLGKMKELGKIDNGQFEQAKKEVDEGLKFSQGDTTTSTPMSYLERAALNQVIEQYAKEHDMETGKAEIIISGGGYKIYTTENSKIQSQMEEIYRNKEHVFDGYYKKDEKLINEGHTQSAMVVIDHKTGNVVGCMGGLGDDVDANGINRATQSPRQPGSSIKPLAAVAPGLESGIITAGTVYDESRTSFGSYSPNPDDPLGQKLYTVGRSIGFSANTIPVKIVAELGPSKSIEFIKKLGISTAVTAKDNSKYNDENLSYVLGGATKGVYPLEMAGAYATIANDGVYIKPTFYTKVVDSNGKVIMEPKQDTRRVLSEGNAYILKTILRGPVSSESRSTAPYCKISGQDTAGKTGTTSNNYDRWFCGFTPYYTAATWYGFDNQENLWRNSSKNPNSTNRAARLWKEVMAKIHKDLPNETFKKPGNVVGVSICMDSGKRATEGCRRTHLEYFVKGTIPEDCEGHQKLMICKETGKIANENCKEVEERIYTKRPEKEDTTLWKTNSVDRYNIPTEVCDVHKKVEVEMPKVIGKTKEEALKILEDLGLIVTVETKESIKKSGIVISQSPKEGKMLKTGDSIIITISKKNEKPNSNKNETEENKSTENVENTENKNNKDDK